jgi:hypothetical protein
MLIEISGDWTDIIPDFALGERIAFGSILVTGGYSGEFSDVLD